MSLDIDVNKERSNITKVTWVILIMIHPDQAAGFKVLMSERISDSNTKELTFPGGSVEPGETPKEAAARETKEETGLVIDQDFLIRASEAPEFFELGETIFVAHPFFAFFDEAVGQQVYQTLEPDKHREWRWYTLDEITDAVGSGALLANTINEQWLENVFFEVIKHIPLPAWFMDECLRIGATAQFDKLRKVVSQQT